jgi:hypothetical protein
MPRRPKNPKSAPRVTLSLRVTPMIRGALEHIALSTGRSIAQEAEYRLQRTFSYDFESDMAARLGSYQVLMASLAIALDSFLERTILEGGAIHTKPLTPERRQAARDALVRRIDDYMQKDTIFDNERVTIPPTTAPTNSEALRAAVEGKE